MAQACSCTAAFFLCEENNEYIVLLQFRSFVNSNKDSYLENSNVHLEGSINIVPSDLQQSHLVDIGAQEQLEDLGNFLLASSLACFAQLHVIAKWCIKVPGLMVLPRTNYDQLYWLPLNPNLWIQVITLRSCFLSVEVYVSTISLSFPRFILYNINLSPPLCALYEEFLSSKTKFVNHLWIPLPST